MKILKNCNSILNSIIGSFIGVFIAHIIYRYFHHKRFPSVYELLSIPWYTSIKIYGLATGIVIIIAIILKLLIKNKLKNN